MKGRDYHLKKVQQALGPLGRQRALPSIPADCRRVLDVGCGAGQTILTLKFRSDATVVGLDLEMESLQLGKQFSPSVHFVCGSGEHLPFRDDSFDFAYSRVSLPYMHIRVALSELNRVLQPGGGLWITLHPASKAVRRILKSAGALNYKDVVY